MPIIQDYYSENFTLIVTGTGTEVTQLTSNPSTTQNIYIYGNFKKINTYCFREYSALINLILPDSIEELGNSIFVGSSLENFTMPRNVKTISTMQSFDETFVLKNIFVAKENPYFCDIDGILYSKDKTILYFIPGGRTEKVQIIPDFVKKLEVAAVSYSKTIETVIIPSSVRRIEWYFGHYATALKEIYILQCKQYVSFDLNRALSGTSYERDPEKIIHYYAPNRCITHNIVCVSSSQFFKWMYLCIIYGIL